MRILVLGADGYLGFATSLYLKSKGHTVTAADNCIKRGWERHTGVKPLIELPVFSERMRDIGVKHDILDLSVNYEFLCRILKEDQPEVIIHYAEQPSAPYSMIDRRHAVETQSNNILGTLHLLFAVAGRCPSTHIVKLGSMGEYGTPNIPIEEGWLDIEHRGRRDRVLFPKRPGSFYHLSKVHDSHNLEFTCRTWGLRCTDLNQGVVYSPYFTIQGERRYSSFHYDHIFGTAINRFMAQSICGEPITVYGRGGQTRGFLRLDDTLRCVELACLNPPREGEFRVFNQFSSVLSLSDAAERVRQAALSLGLHPTIEHIDNPRIEAEEHFYDPIRDALPSIGFEPSQLTVESIADMMEYLMPYREEIDKKQLLPNVKWRQG